MSLKELKYQHREVARLKTLGLKTPEIADQMSISIASVNGILSQPLCKEYMKSIDDQVTKHVIDVRKELVDKHVTAIDTIEAAMAEGTPWPTRLRAAQDVLDRTGYAPIRQNVNVNMTHQLTKEDIAEINKRAREEGIISEHAIKDCKADD